MAQESGETLLTGVITYYSVEAKGFIMHWDAAWVSGNASSAPGAHHS